MIKINYLAKSPFFYSTLLLSLYEDGKGAIMNRMMDLTSQPEEKRFEKVLLALEGIRSEEELGVKSDEDLFPLLKRLQNESAGNIVWFPMKTNNDVWTATILKTDDNPSLHKSLAAFLTYDHTRCDHFYAELEASLHEENIEMSEELLRLFSRSLNRHQDIEEKVFFPDFEEESKIIIDTTDVLRKEHGQMRNILIKMHSALEDKDRKAVLDFGEELVCLIRQHNSKEENVLYPMMDSHLGSEASTLIKKTQLSELA